MLISLTKSFVALALIFMSLYYTVFVLDSVGVTAAIIHYPSLALVVGVLVGVALLTTEVKDLRRFFKFLFGYSASQARRKLTSSEANFEQMLELYTTQGTTAFREFIRNSSLPKVWEIVATKLEIRVPPSDIRNIMKYQIKKTVSQVDQDIASLRQLCALAPSIGMLGSVLGLIKLLANLKDFSSLGTNMSLALITTLYGIFIANVFFVPLIRRLETRRFLLIKNHENILYWIGMLEENKPSFYLKSRLSEMGQSD